MPKRQMISVVVCALLVVLASRSSAAPPHCPMRRPVDVRCRFGKSPLRHLTMWYVGVILGS